MKILSSVIGFQFSVFSKKSGSIKIAAREAIFIFRCAVTA
jgi:hypothetical protein